METAEEIRARGNLAFAIHSGSTVSFEELAGPRASGGVSGAMQPVQRSAAGFTFFDTQSSRRRLSSTSQLLDATLIDIKPCLAFVNRGTEKA
jgi:hypothetical protein